MSRCGVRILLLMCTAVAMAADAAELLVPEQYASIQSAVRAARSGDTVLVSEGNYFEHVNIDKPLTLVSRTGPEHTVIDWRFDEIETATIAIGSDNVRLSGFTVSGGYGERAGGVGLFGRTGVTIENCWVIGNFARLRGGGISIEKSSAVVRNNRVIGNDHDGISVVGPVLGTVVIEDNVIEDNLHGGVEIYDVSNTEAQSVRIVRNVIRANRVGSGIRSYRSGALLVADNLIIQNEGNRAAGGIVWDSPDQVAPSLWVNNTVADNQGEGAVADQVTLNGDMTSIVLANNILAGGTVLSCEGQPTFAYNDLFGATEGECAAAATGGTNMTVDPLFTKGKRHGNPYHPSETSPLIDAGSNSHAQEARVKRDLGGRPRILDGGHELRVDIGVFEYKPR